MTIDALEKAAHTLEGRALSVLQHANYQAQHYRALIPELRTLTEAFERDGVALITSSMQQRMECDLGYKAHQYFRDVATGLKRLPVFGLEGGQHVYGQHNGTWSSRSLKYIELSLPRNKRTENLVAGLLLISHTIIGSSLLACAAPVAKEETARTWTFYFLDEPGRKIFDDFMEQCRTNPVFRIILKGTAR